MHMHMHTHIHIHICIAGEMGEAAAAQLDALRSDLTNLDPTSDEARALGTISSDLELFVEQSAKQRGKVRSRPYYSHTYGYTYSHTYCHTYGYTYGYTYGHTYYGKVRAPYYGCTTYYGKVSATAYRHLAPTSAIYPPPGERASRVESCLGAAQGGGGWGGAWGA